MRPPPVLTKLNRRPGLAADQSVSGIIVGMSGLFDPDKLFFVELADALHGFGYREGLVVVGHQQDRFEPRRDQFAHFGGRAVSAHNPQSAAVVGLYWSWLAPQHAKQR